LEGGGREAGFPLLAPGHYEGGVRANACPGMTMVRWSDVSKPF
jgi:hypothetical protein